MFLTIDVCVLPIYHMFWVSSSPTQWCLGCYQTFQSTLYTPHHNHLDCFDLTKGNHSLCLESIGRPDFVFGKEDFEPFLPFMVAIVPFFQEIIVKFGPPCHLPQFHNSIVQFSCILINEKPQTIVSNLMSHS
jgi:hypothetical protein